MTNAEDGLRPSLKLFPFVVGVITAIMGIMVFAGWVWDVPALKSILPGFATMKANTSLGIALVGGRAVPDAVWRRRQAGGQGGGGLGIHHR